MSLRPYTPTVAERWELLLITCVVGIAGWLVWNSPAIYHGGAEWFDTYSACLEAQPKAETLGVFLDAARCAEKRTGRR